MYKSFERFWKDPNASKAIKEVLGKWSIDGVISHFNGLQPDGINQVQSLAFTLNVKREMINGKALVMITDEITLCGELHHLISHG